MTEHSRGSEPRQSLHLSSKVGRIAESLAKLSLGQKHSSEQDGSERRGRQPEISQETVSLVIKARRARARYLPSELFIDPAWDMLLELLHAEVANRALSVTDLFVAPGVPETSAARWLNALVEHGLVDRKANGEKPDLVELTPGASSALRRYFHDVLETR